MEDESARNGFTTYKNYLLALSYLLPSYSEILATQKEVIQQKSFDLKRIKKLLVNSWNSELLLNLPGLLNKDILKFSNHWSPVQGYYAIYLASRSLILAKNMEASGDHSTTLNILVSLVQTEKLFPSPWNRLYDISTTYDDTTNKIFVNPLEDPFYFRNDNNKLLSSLIMFLRTTFERVVDEKCHEWKLNHPIKNRPRKKLSPGVRNQISIKQRKVSIFDCLYRLRIRSNYKDVDIFILGSSKPETERYFDSICKITDRTLFLLENYIRRYVGNENMDNIISEYKKTDSLNILNKLQYSVLKRSSITE